MGKVLVIGAGGVSTVAVKKLAMNADVFDEIMVASRTKSKCDKIAADIQNVKVQTAQVDADNVDELVALFEAFKPELVVNLALPYQDLHIMDACLRYGVSYLDTANYEPLDEAKYQYSWQWAYKKRFEDAGLTAILGCGFDPGVTGVYTAYAAKHHFDEIQYLDIVDWRDYATGQILRRRGMERNRPAVGTQTVELSEYRTARILFDVSRRVGKLDEKLSDYQTGTFLDDVRTGIFDPFACYPEYRNGKHQTDPV